MIDHSLNRPRNHYLGKNLLVPLILFAINVGIKLLFLASQPISGDEPFSIYHAQYPISTIVDLLIQGNNPPLYEILLHFWLQVFGIDPFAVRFPSALFSALAVIFIYKIGYRFFNLEIAIVASLLFTFSNHHIYLAHTARVYSIFVFLAVWSMYLFLSHLYQSTSRTYFWGLGIVNALMIYSHYFGYFIIAVQVISVLFSSDKRATFFIYLKILGITLLLFSPMIFVLAKRFYESVSGGTWLDPPSGFEALYRKIKVFSNEPVVAVLGIAILVISLAIYLWDKNKYPSFPGKIIGIWFLFPYLFMFLVSFWVPMWFERYLTFMTPGFYLLLTLAGFSIINRGKWRFLLPGLMLLGFMVTFKPDMPRRKPDKAVEYVKSRLDKNTLVLGCPDYFIPDFTYHYNRSIFQKTALPPFSALESEMARKDIHFLTSIHDFGSDVQGYDKVIYFDAGASGIYPNNQIRLTVEKHFELKEKASISAYTVYVYD